jgi:dTDP-glucose 4,6-dehydratase
MLQGNVVRLGDPTPIRDLMYVDDHVNSYLACLDSDKAVGETFNFCTGHGVSIAKLVELSKQPTGFKSKIIWNTIPKRPLDIAVLVGDYSKAKRILGWKPKFTLETGLKLTTDFWRNKLSEGSS